MANINVKGRISVVDTVFAVLWIIILLSGLTLKLTVRYFDWPRSRYDLAENRYLAEFPKFGTIPVKSWGQACESWYNDHFAMRGFIIHTYRLLHFKVFKSPVKRFVPGRGNWIFGRMANDGKAGDVWPEVEDYMGAVRLDDSTVNDWKTLFEGHVAWAEAHGIHYLEVLPPMKASVHPEKMLPMIACHKKDSCREDLRKALASSFVHSNVLFLAESLRAEVQAGREVFYEEDHHENAYGCFCIYRDIVAKMRELWYPDLGEFPFYEGVIPQKVKEGIAPGCWVNQERRLIVRNPGMKAISNPKYKISVTNSPFPYGPVCIARETPGIKVLVGHDSFLRYPFSSWHDKNLSDFTLPVGDGISQMSMFIFTRFNITLLEKLISNELPDVIIEEFSEGRLQFGVKGKKGSIIEKTTRRAAAWSHGVRIEPGATSNVSGLMALAVLDNLQLTDAERPISIELRDVNNKLITSENVLPGVRRAVFFGDISSAPGLHAVLANGKADSLSLEFRTH